MQTLSGARALVTGGASGIGAATARLLAQQGARVTLVDLPAATTSAQALADAIGASFIGADVGDVDEWDRIARAVGRLDLVHLNAGVVAGPDVFALDLDAYRRAFRVNVDGVVFGIRALVPAMHGGAIVATASLAGVGPYVGDPVYAATKHAVVGLVRSLGPVLEPRGITINCVCPGMTATGLLTKEAEAEIAAQGLRLMEPAQVAAAVISCFEGDETGQAWIVELGRDLMPYQFRGIPGPRW
jgi:NAD(P)-dependent dehydrogenase (short-subunit alcohol dehydrogenase family)